MVMNPKMLMKGMKMPPRQGPSVEVEIGEDSGDKTPEGEESPIDLTSVSDQELIDECNKRGLSLEQ